ncbi:hypothetical protein [Streptomyces sp. NPDC060194]|uniref:hypothetical protein n=1 Tax=Streptomyces sp. NPDC060194 TaxID=3347069 RepID=UPI0036481B40
MSTEPPHVPPQGAHGQQPPPPGGTTPQWGAPPPGGGPYQAPPPPGGGGPYQGPPPGGYHPGQPPPEKKKRKKWPWVLLACILLFIGGCAAVTGLFVNSVSDEINKDVTVTYKVTGDARDVTIDYTVWEDDNMSSSTERDAKLPWTKTQTTDNVFEGGSLTVSTGASGGTVTCTATVKGEDPKTATASGPYATASCDGF